MADVKPPPDALSMQRGDYSRTLAGPLLIALRGAVSIPLQYYLLTNHPLSAFGVSRPPADGSIVLPYLGPQPRLSTIFVGMTATLCIKQNAWLWGYCNERITVPFGCFGIIVPAIYESICALVFSGAEANPLWRPEFLYAGATIHLLAAVTELVIELHRAAFKSKPENKGKLFTSGLWGWVRHPNYAMNVIYGTMYGFAAGGPLFALFTGGFYWSNLTQNATPAKEKYLAEKYPEQWETYKKDVPWKLFPGIF